jgi:hypothetical protein
MKSQKASNHKSSSNSVAPVVLFGLDQNGKPKGARFADKHASLATKAAGQMQLQVLAITDPRVAEVAAQLPPGRVHANGRGFVPFIRRDLYARLVAAAGTPVPGVQETAPAANPGTTSDVSGTNGFRPRNWDEIGPGALVIAQDSLPEGWYAAIVIDRNGEMLTLRWRDFPRERRFSVHRFTVALVCPNVDNLPGQDKQAAHSIAKAQSVKSAAGKRPSSDPGTADQHFPQTWDQIDVNHLVLARDDGPWRSWWEAIPAEKSGDLLTLRWRDHSQLPHIVRKRVELALLYPKMK